MSIATTFTDVLTDVSKCIADGCAQQTARESKLCYACDVKQNRDKFKPCVVCRRLMDADKPYTIHPLCYTYTKTEVKCGDMMMREWCASVDKVMKDDKYTTIDFGPAKWTGFCVGDDKWKKFTCLPYFDDNGVCKDDGKDWTKQFTVEQKKAISNKWNEILYGM